MSDRDDIARRLLAVVTLGKRIAEVEKALRLRASEAFTKVGQREVGDLGTAGDLGTVQLDRGASSWRVTDADALQAFVAETFPEQIETVPAFERIRPAYVTALLADIKGMGAAVTRAGEPIPGVELFEADPKVVVKAASDAAEVLAQGLASREITLLELTFEAAAIEAAS